jgi:hypothetical protein
VLLEATDWAAPADDDAPTPTTNPITDPTSAATTTNPRLMCDRCPRIVGRLLCPVMVDERNQLRDDAGK